MAESRVVPLRLKVFAAVVVILGAVVLWAEWGALGTVALERSQNLVTVVSLILFIAIGGAFPLRLTPRVKISVSTAPAFAAVLVLPPVIAALVILAGTLTYHAYLHAVHKRTWFDALFNTSRACLQGALAAQVYVALQPLSLTKALATDWVAAGFAMVVAAGIYYAVNVATVFGAAGMSLHQNPARLWVSNVRMDVPQQTFLFVFGLLTALISVTLPILTVAMLLPVLVVQFGWKSALDLRTQSRGALEAIADAVDVRTYGEFGHSRRVAELAAELARSLALNPAEIDTVRSAARVHDIGKMGFSDDLLRRYALTLDPVDLEFRRHSEVAWQLLGRIAEYRVGREYVRHQCERPDGSGFPMCLPAERIPVGAAIIRVAEAYDVLASRTEGELAAQMVLALTQLRHGSGRLWDARVIDALEQIAERRMNALGHEAASFASAEV